MIGNKRRLAVLCLALAAVLLLAACGDKANESPSGRPFSDSKGDKELPVQPARIITTQYLSHMLALGAKPAGAPDFLLDFISHLSGLSGRSYDVSGIADIGYPPNVEKMLKLNPDLIVTLDEENYDAYDKIAPTAIVPFLDLDVRDQLLGVGEAINRRQQAEDWLADYDRRAAEVKDKLAQTAEARGTIGIYRINQKELRVYGARNGGYVMYRSLGLQPPKPIADKIAQDPDFVYDTISLEKLPDYAADLMLVLVSDDQDSKAFLEEMENSSLWKNLDAVKRGKVRFVDNRVWLDYSPLALDYQLDQIRNVITGMSGQEEDDAR